MRNKLPILLALILMAVAAMPWLRSLESQRWGLPSGSTTVPPPEPAATQAISASRVQNIESQTVTSSSQPPARVACDPAPARQVVDASQSAPPKPKALVDCAVRAVETRPFISARIKQQGELFGHQITGEGRYYELRQGPIPRIHLELTVEVGSVSTSLVQVCNGATLWTYRKLPNAESLSKVDAVRAITALEQAAGKLPREAIASAPGLGGLGRLMRGLNSRFEFTSVVADQLGGLPVWKLSGGWKPAQLARFLPNQKEAIEKGRSLDLSRLPGHLPDSVALFLGQEDCFPFRIDYLRSVPKSSPRRLMGLEFFELNFNGPIDSGQFLFTPGSLEIIDRTEEFVRSIGEGG
jgi:hypothetical protein